MRKFTDFIKESCVAADVNQGNALKLGVTNHYTPIQNIVTNIRNLFSVLSIVTAVAEDGVSVEIHSTKFVSEEAINNVIYSPVYNTTLAQYIISQGLPKISIKNLGQYYVVYFSPDDIKSAKPGKETEPAKKPEPTNESFIVSEDEQMPIYEANADDDEEMQDLTKAKIKDIITSDDKVKAAKQLELLVGQEMELPKEYYFAGVTTRTSNENSIALRWKYTKRGGHNETVEIVKSLINIYDLTNEGIFVPDFDKNSMFQLPDEVRKLIENILDFLGAEKTNDECVYSLESLSDEGSKKSKEDDKPKEGEDDKPKEGEDDKPKEGEDDKPKEDDDLLG